MFSSLCPSFTGRDLVISGHHSCPRRACGSARPVVSLVDCRVKGQLLGEIHDDRIRRTVPVEVTALMLEREREREREREIETQRERERAGEGERERERESR